MQRGKYHKINMGDLEYQEPRKSFDLTLPNYPGQVFLINNIENEEIAEETETIFKTTCEKLKFLFHVEKKSELKNMRKMLYAKLSKINDNVSYYGSIVVFVLTHQQKDGRLVAADRSYDSNEIITPFHKFTELKDIPKIFFFLIYNKNCDSANENYETESSTYLSSIPKLKGFNFLISVSPAYDGYAQNLCNALQSWKHSNADLINFLYIANSNLTTLTSNYNWVISSSLQKSVLFSSLNKNKHEADDFELSLLSFDETGNVAINKEIIDISKSNCRGKVLIYCTDIVDKKPISDSTVAYDLLATFARLCFEVVCHCNYTQKEIETMINNLAKADFSEYGCLCVIVITPTIENMLLASDGPFHASKIWKPFQNCSSLLEKPKLFFFQGSAQNFDINTDFQKNTVVTFSGTDGEKSNGIERGTVFFQVLCEALKEWERRPIDLLTLISEVQTYVTNIHSTKKRMELIQMPFFTSTLTKEVILSGFGGSQTSKGPKPRPKKLFWRSSRQPTDGLENDSIAYLDDEQSSEDEETDESVHSSTESIRNDPIECKNMFGLQESADKIVNDEFKSAIEEFNDDKIQEFEDKLNKYENNDNIQFLAKDLLNLIFTNDRDSLAEVLISKFDLPQEEILYFLWRIITDAVWREDLFTKTCIALKRRHQKFCLLQYHMDFTHRHASSAIGFPILCALQSPCGDLSILKKKIELLIKYGAQVNDCHEESREISCIQFAIVNNLGEDVLGVLKNTSSKEKNSLKKDASKLNEKVKSLFKCLYTANEKEFIGLLESDTTKKININAHDGKYTLLQLAIKNNLCKAAKKLLDNKAKQSIMAGYCTQPIIIALETSNVEMLELFLVNTSNLNLRFCCDNSTFLHHLSKKCKEPSLNSMHYLKQLKNLVQKSIEQFIHISALDMDGKSSLEICAQSSNVLLKILLDNGGFLNIDDAIASTLKPSDLAYYFEDKIRIDPLTEIEIDYSYLKPLNSVDTRNNNIKNLRAAEMLPFLELARWEKFHEVLVQSPVTKFFILNKWKQFAFIYVLNFFLALLFTISFSLYVYYKLQRKDKDYDFLSFQNIETIEIICLSFSSVCWFLLLFRELYQFITSTREYILIVENYIEIFKLVFTFLTFILTANTLSNTEYRFIPAFAITSNYIELTLLLRTHPWAEAYITMFKEVSKKTFKLLLLFLCFILAFVGGFHIMLHMNNFEYSTNTNNTSPDNNNTRENFINKNYDSSNYTVSDENNIENIFSELWYSLIKTSVMLLGEFDIKDMLQFTNFGSEIMFIIFLIFVPIILLNLLNALAISDTQIIVKHAQLLCCISNIKLYCQMESSILQYSETNPGNRCYGFEFMTKRNWISRFIRRITIWFGSDISEFSKQKYELIISLNQNGERKDRNKREKCKEFRKKIKEWIIKFYNWSLQINDYKTAKEIAKRYSGKIYRSIDSNKYKKNIKNNGDTSKNLEERNAHKSEIKGLRLEVNQMKEEFAETREEIKLILEQLQEIKKIVQTQAVGTKTK